MAAATVKRWDDEKGFPYLAVGVVPYYITVTLATTSLDDNDDKVVISPALPRSAKIVGGFVDSDDLDSNGSPALVIDLAYGDVDGTIDADIWSAISGVQDGTGGVLPYTALGVEVPADKHFILHTATAAATAAAGDIEIMLLLAFGTLDHLGDADLS